MTGNENKRVESSGEKRTYRRTRPGCQVEIALPNGETAVGNILDLSLDALHMECATPIEIEADVTFRIKSGGPESPVKSEIRGTGRVVRVSESGSVVELLTFQGVDFNVFSDFLMHFIGQTG